MEKMPKIKLFSGMDFSGKTTIINGINNKIPSTFKIKKKFLTPIDLIENVRKMDTWLSPEEWKPLLQKNIQMDIDNYKEDGLVLLDSLWIIKYLAGKIEKGDKEDEEEICILKELLKKYPQMDSFYITVSMEERIKRFYERSKLGEEITGSDKLIMDVKKFEEREKNYKKIVLETFPNTKIIDTTNISLKETIELIINDKNFVKDM
jgi:thymidylate kinase